MNGDWLWFRARPARAYRARLATRAEVDALTAQDAIDPALVSGVESMQNRGVCNFFG